ncbi:hypothetical protein MTO96_043180 [Rhipicephalus appendiculatus]
MITDCSAFILFSLQMINCNSANIVYPRLLESRDGNGDLVLNIHKKLTLYLEKSTVLADNFYLDSSTAAGTRRTTLKGQDIEANLYHDKKHQSSLIVTRSINGIEVRGILNSEFTITPALVSERSSNGTVAHNITPIERTSRVGVHEDARKNGKSLQYHANIPSNAKVKRRRSPSKFVVELWLLVSKEYRAAFNNCDEFLIYLATTVNANDTLTKDEVCSVHNEGLWRRISQATCGVDAEDTLNKTRFLVGASMEADLFYLLTSKDLVYNFRRDNITILSDVLGIAYMSGVCTSLKAGVGEDQPRTYSGVTTMAHEISHLLGSLHDGQAPPPNMEGHPGGANCPPRDGYLMGDSMFTHNEYRLSSCTKEQIQYNFRRLPRDCIMLRKEAIEKNDNYPGQILDHLKYCQALHPNEPDVWPEDKRGQDYKKCKISCCWISYYEEEDYTETFCEDHRMLEAMPCGQNKDTTPCHPIMCVLFSGGCSWGSAAEYSSLAMNYFIAILARMGRTPD